MECELFELPTSQPLMGSGSERGMASSRAGKASSAVAVLERVPSSAVAELPVPLAGHHASKRLANLAVPGVAALPRTVVLVSVDASFRQRLSVALTGLRWRVREAGGGAEALAHLAEASAEALLLDSWLPDLEVGEFAEQLHETHPEVDLVWVDGGMAGGGEMAEVSSAWTRSPRRHELLHALRRAQEQDVDGAAWNSAPVAVPVSAMRRTAAAPAERGSKPIEVAGGQEPLTSIGGEGGDLVERDLLDIPEGFAPSCVQAAAEDSMAEVLRARGHRNLEIQVPVVAIPGMVGAGPAMKDLARLVRLVAPRSATVLIEGATGTGKEVVARALHRLGSRASKPFTVLNCAAIPEALLEAELFGHTRGAFTGAVQSRTGRIEAAHGGTLFLDEIGEMPLGLQAKLLRFLECGELQRVGENEPVRVDVRVIAATHQPLEQRSAEGRFRADLYYRLAVFPVYVPALAERMEDLPLLAAHFLSRLGDESPVKRLSSAAVRKLQGHGWPGNVRELGHVLERAVILAEERAEIGPEDIRFGSGRC